jgi:hypothetical protein
MSPEELKFIQDNVPYVTDQQIYASYSKNNNNILDTLTDLLNISKPVEKEKTDWEIRREICDSYDTEMQKVIKRT